jgi:hypothetical protein
VINLSEKVLLKWQISAGYALGLVDDVLVLYKTRARSGSRIITSIPVELIHGSATVCLKMAQEGNLQACRATTFWAIIDMEEGVIPIDYSKLDLKDPKIMDRLQHRSNLD